MSWGSAVSRSSPAPLLRGNRRMVSGGWGVPGGCPVQATGAPKDVEDRTSEKAWGEEVAKCLVK